jgi:hypothetical protein
VKLLDFGVGKLLDPQVEEELPLTRGGICAFTPEYASPEQIRGRDTHHGVRRLFTRSGAV